MRCEECVGKGWTRAFSRNEDEADECPVCKGEGQVMKTWQELWMNNWIVVTAVGLAVLSALVLIAGLLPWE